MEFGRRRWPRSHQMFPILKHPIHQNGSMLLRGGARFYLKAQIYQTTKKIIIFTLNRQWLPKYLLH